MKAFQIIIDFVTSLIITSGGAAGIAFLASKGEALSKPAWAAIFLLGLVQAAKGTRNLVGLPPLSNGNYDTIAQFIKEQKKDTETKP